METYFRKILQVIVIKGHSFIHIVLHDHHLREFLEDSAQLGDLFLTKDFPDRVVRSVKDKDFGSFIEGGLDSFIIDLPIVIRRGNVLLSTSLSDHFLGLLSELVCTLIFGLRGIPRDFPPAI